MKILTFAIFLLPLIYAQNIILPDDDGFASRFFIKIHQANAAIGESFRCSGVLLNPRHTLTIATPIHNLLATNLRLFWGNTRISNAQADSALAELMTVHPNFNATNPRENNLAVVRISVADSARTATAFFHHRNLGHILENHFCTMLGFGTRIGATWLGTEQMNMVVARPLNTTVCNHLFPGNFFCSIGAQNLFTQCGGFVGAPIICDGQTLAGLVVQDQFCGLNPRVYIIDIGHHHEWIHRTSSNGRAFASIVLIITSFLYVKLF